MKGRALLLLLLLPLLGGAAWLGALLWKQRQQVPAPSQERLASLRQQRAALRDRFRDLTTGANDLDLEQASEGGLLVGVPESLARSLIEQTLTGLFGETKLTLKDLKVEKSDEVKGRLLFATRTFGTFDLSVYIEEVKGTLRPGTPIVQFEKNRVAVEVPVRVAEGAGRAVIGLYWDGKGVADVVCGDMDVKRAMTGTVVPRDHRVVGAFEIAMDGGAMVFTPRFGEVSVPVEIKPSEETWQSIDALIEEQGALCRAALKKVDLKARLAELLAKGFDVKLPAKLFKPVRLPVGVLQKLTLQDVAVSLAVKPAGLRMAKQRIWYGVNVDAIRDAPAGATPVPSPSASASSSPKPVAGRRD